MSSPPRTIASASAVAERVAGVPNLVRAMIEPIGAHERAMRQIDDARLLQLVSVQPLDETHPEALPRARRRVEALPDWSTLRGWASKLDAALEEPADEERTRVLLALLLDGFTRRVPSPQTFLDAATFLLAEDRFGPSIVSSACRRLLEQRKTPPAYAFVAAEARAARSAIATARVLVQRAFAARQRAEAIIARAEA